MKKLTYACIASLAIALTGCPDNGGKDDAGVSGDTGAKKPDTGVAAPDAAGTATDGSTTCDHDKNCQGRQCGDDGCGGTCGSCADGQSCNPAGVCVAKTCAPPVGPCGDFQYCDTTQADPVCVEICNPPNGCPANEECIKDAVDAGTATTGTCSPPSCDGVLCKQGQVCVDFAEEGAPEDLHCSCMPYYEDSQGNESQDTCVDYGKVCPIDVTDAATIVPSECRLPEEFEDCNPTVGCATVADGGKLDCLKLSTSAMCLRACGDASGNAKTEKCLYDFTACYGKTTTLKNHCYFNICSDISCEGATNCTEASERALYFKPCSSIALNDSLCMQWAFSDGSEIGVCLQGGTANIGDECDPSGERHGSPPYTTTCKTATVTMDTAAPNDMSKATITAPGSYCSPVMPDPNDATKSKGVCKQLCNAWVGPNPAPIPSGAGVQCTAGDLCVDVTGVDGLQKTITGYCMKKCDLFGTDSCGTDRFGNTMGCWPNYNLAGEGFCRASVPNAGKIGSTCAMSDTDNRNECGDRLVCMQYTNEDAGICVGWCQSAVCPSEAADCGQCTGTKCCTPACTGKCNGEADGCGGKCGCPANQKCNTTSNTCEACTPACTGKCAGEDDGCGGKCGCTDPLTKCVSGACTACTSTCVAGKCGMSNGCSGTCACTGAGEWCSRGGDCKATCNADADCAANFKCNTTSHLCECVPNCYLKGCGSDGCGGTCGTACAGTDTCVTVGAGQYCTPASYDANNNPVVTPVELCDFH